MRRSDREIKQLDDILKVLDKCDVLRIALCDNNKPYIVPMNFCYKKIEDNIYIYIHSAPVGKKIDIVKNNNNVCFEADCDYKTIKNDSACEWSAEYKSVIGEGTISIIDDNAKKQAALDLLMEKHGYDDLPIYNDKMLSNVAVLEIVVTSITGKCNIKK